MNTSGQNFRRPVRSNSEEPRKEVRATDEIKSAFCNSARGSQKSILLSNRKDERSDTDN